jgi:hypothetical protein
MQTIAAAVSEKPPYLFRQGARSERAAINFR